MAEEANGVEDKNIKKKSGKRKKTFKDRILDVIIVLLLLVALGSGGYLARDYYIAKTAQSNFDDLKSLMDIDDPEDDYDSGTGDNKSYKTADGELTILKKYKKLYEKNNDIAGWLKIDDTTIDYPVMYTPGDNEYYLHLDFDKNWSDPGTPFIDENCRPFDNRTTNVLIYGHNMKSGIMFRELLQYEDKDFCKSHNIIKFDTIYETGRYEVVGAFRAEIYPSDDTDHFHYYEFFDAADNEEFDEFIDFVKQNSPYDTGITPEYGDELITLSTCASHVEDGRFVVVARKINEKDK